MPGGRPRGGRLAARERAEEVKIYPSRIQRGGGYSFEDEGFSAQSGAAGIDNGDLPKGKELEREIFEVAQTLKVEREGFQNKAAQAAKPQPEQVRWKGFQKKAGPPAESVELLRQRNATETEYRRAFASLPPKLQHGEPCNLNHPALRIIGHPLNKFYNAVVTVVEPGGSVRALTVNNLGELGPEELIVKVFGTNECVKIPVNLLV